MVWLSWSLRVFFLKLAVAYKALKPNKAYMLKSVLRLLFLLSSQKEWIPKERKGIHTKPQSENKKQQTNKKIPIFFVSKCSFIKIEFWWSESRCCFPLVTSFILLNDVLYASVVFVYLAKLWRCSRFTWLTRALYNAKVGSVHQAAYLATPISDLGCVF